MANDFLISVPTTLYFILVPPPPSQLIELMKPNSQRMPYTVIFLKLYDPVSKMILDVLLYKNQDYFSTIEQCVKSAHFIIGKSILVALFLSFVFTGPKIKF